MGDPKNGIKIGLETRAARRRDVARRVQVMAEYMHGTEAVYRGKRNELTLKRAEEYQRIIYCLLKFNCSRVRVLLPNTLIS